MKNNGNIQRQEEMVWIKDKQSSDQVLPGHYISVALNFPPVAESLSINCTEQYYA